MARESRKPLLAVDVGNTQTVLGLFEDGHLGRRWRLATEAQRTGDELGIFLRGLLDLESLGGICLSSSVPTMVRAFEEVADEVEARLLVLGPGTKTGIPIRYDDPRELGPDRIANAVAARERYGTPGIVVSMEALFERAARLGQVDFVEPPSAIGKTTSSALQAGLVYGFAGQVDGIVERIRTELGDGAALVVATGGLASLIVPHAKTVERVDPFLTLEGLHLVWERNRE